VPLAVELQAGVTMLSSFTLAEAAAALARGDATSEQLVVSCLERIAAREAEVGAWAHVDPEQAVADARTADAARRSGRGTGPLNGVPIGVKDIIDVAGRPAEHGSPVFKGRRALKDAAVVTALRNAGAVILGKTVTTELALLTPAATRNPRDLARSPGGSSAGSAAAVADFMVPAAIGTQTAGSVLRPASYCGIYGFKPTLGLVPRSGILMQSHTLDTVGVLTRTIEDAALVTDVLAAPDPADPVSYQRSQPSLRATAMEDAPLPPLFAVIKTPAWDSDAHPVMREAFDEFVAALGDRCQVMDLASAGDAIEAQRIVQLAENAAYYRPLLERAPELISPGLTQRLETGLAIQARRYIDAVRAREGLYDVIDEITTNFTAILTLAAPGPAPLLSEGITGSPIFNGLWTYYGCPCLSLPAMEADGLPMGVQLVGARGDDGRLLRTARWLESRLADLAA
jgi:Asp-tRNA(Asn)/Glu-tRNA(Gln) amidotransferase A subunit family amidase